MESYCIAQEAQPGALGQPAAAAAATKSLQSCLTLCNPIDSSPPGSPVPGILQARTLEWVAISFSNAWNWKVKGKLLSRVRLLATQWTTAYQAPPSMGFSRQEYWSGVPLPCAKRGTAQVILVSQHCTPLPHPPTKANLSDGQKKNCSWVSQYRHKIIENWMQPNV